MVAKVDLIITGHFNLLGYFASRVRGLRAYEPPTEVTVFDKNGTFLRTEKPVVFTTKYNNSRIEYAEFGEVEND